jgi:PAS domain-containing protein
MFEDGLLLVQYKVFMKTGIARLLSRTGENPQKWVGEEALPSVFRQRFNLLFVSLFVLSMQLVVLPVHAIEMPGSALPGFEWAALSVVVLVVVALFWYRTRFKDAQRLAVLHRAALDNMENAVLLADRRGQNVLSNRNWNLRVAGNNSEMVLGPNLGLAGLKGILFDEEPNRQALQELEVAAAAHEAADREIAIIDKNGHKAWCRLSVRPVDGDQQLSMWSLADADVRNAVEAAIDVEQGLLTDFLNEFPIGYFSADEQGHFVHANTTFAEWLGTTPEKLIGGGKRLQEYLAEGNPGGGAPWSLLPTQEAIGCAKVDFVAGDGR